MLQENNPDAACMYHTDIYEREGRVNVVSYHILGLEKHKGKSFAYHGPGTYVSFFFFLGRSDFDFFVGFENTDSELHMLDGILALANSVCFACVVAL